MPPAGGVTGEDGAVCTSSWWQTRRRSRSPVDRALQEADLVVEQTYRTAPIEHAYLEPEAGLAYVEADGTVTVLKASTPLQAGEIIDSTFTIRPCSSRFSSICRCRKRARMSSRLSRANTSSHR